MTASTAIPKLSLVLDPEMIDGLASAVVVRVAELLPEPTDDSWLDSRGAAAYLAVPLSTVRTWTARGELPGYQDTPGLLLQALRPGRMATVESAAEVVKAMLPPCCLNSGIPLRKRDRQ